jgi:predicted ATPase
LARVAVGTAGLPQRRAEVADSASGCSGRSGARDQLLWYARIEAEHDNLRAAIDWSAGDGTDRELRRSAALPHFWLQRGYLAEGRES